MEKIEDIYQYIGFIYKCSICGQRFPIWWVSKEEWKKSGLGNRATVCKECFEYNVPSPHYYTIDEYMKERIHTDNEEVRAYTRKVLEEIWNMPAEYDCADEETKRYILGDLKRRKKNVSVSVEAKLLSEES